MRIIYNKIIPLSGYSAINLFGFVFARKEHNPLSNRTINHESIHTAQMREMLYVPFYLWYGIEWLILMIKYRNSKLAYYNIRFEREAYSNDSDLDYLKIRKKFAWIKY